LCRGSLAKAKGVLVVGVETSLTGLAVRAGDAFEAAPRANATTAIVDVALASIAGDLLLVVPSQ
jgi:hypothetical protein